MIILMISLIDPALLIEFFSRRDMQIWLQPKSRRYISIFDSNVKEGLVDGRSLLPQARADIGNVGRIKGSPIRTTYDCGPESHPLTTPYGVPCVVPLRYGKRPIGDAQAYGPNGRPNSPPTNISEVWSIVAW
ncbi:uncharacterized protein BO80DRAFT_65691 [Aspergillus ibericus CBS 121593]|uniref:Uncharacterized protein n=1 Tax=Aspergillus ibericus CBS 121593 TaxID=1448316 RepID=A0A395H0G7_9EURO|nr:hypothetical protein BO80DRAFT_65691 [Aspergillus ibericus CBS 121593]RAL01327.1 hypothetical protein BO80DRAFT_65691 [Aspergillus ibericus CBS 121593]